MSTTPRPLHHRQLPWLGILLLLFFTVAWARSCFYRDEARIPFLLFENHLGWLGFTVNPRFDFATYAGTCAISPHRFWFPSTIVTVISTPGALGIHISHWFLILLTLIASFILHLRKRKQLRLLTDLHHQAASQAAATSTSPDSLP